MFEDVAVVVLLPLLVGLLDPLGHLLERGLEHGGELLTHLVDLPLQPRDLVDLLLLNYFMLSLQVVQILVQLLDARLVLVFFSLQLAALGAELLEAGLVLAGHIRHDVPLPALLLFQELLELQVTVPLFILGGFRPIRHLLLHDKLLRQGLYLSLENEILLHGVRVGIVALLLSTLLLSSFLLSSHIILFYEFIMFFKQT